MTALPSASVPRGVTPGQRASALRRFEDHRVAWGKNPALRELYQGWYDRIRRALLDVPDGPRIELGSGPGFAHGFIPDLLLTDLVQAPWHDRQLSADHLPYPDGHLGGLVLFDVLHHLASPSLFFEEATRALAPGGRIVICDPYIGPLSYPVYRFLHPEPVDMNADVVNQNLDHAKDPFDSNQAIATLLFGRQRRAFEQRFAGLEIESVETMAGLSYPASGGFSRRPLLPLPAWRVLHALENLLPVAVFRLIGFRIFVVLRRR
jgi:SAM-dependent methyltransferase